MDERIVDLFKETKDKFVQLYGGIKGCRYVECPSSLVFLGDHTHYNEGVLLSVGVNKYVTAIGRKRKDNKILIASNFTEEIIEADSSYVIKPGSRLPVRYMVNLFTTLREKEIIKNGFEIALTSDIPDCFGLGSIAAHQMALLKLVNSLCKLKLSRTALIELSGGIEKKIIGRLSNEAHHSTIVNSHNKSFLFSDLRTKVFKNIPFENEQYEIILLDTEKIIPDSLKMCTERIEECSIGSDTLKTYMWGIKSLRDISDDFLKKKIHMLPKRVYQRINYNVSERNRVETALTNIFNNEIEEFGKCINASHKSISSDYLISSEEIDYLVNESIAFKGVIASKMVSCSPKRSLFAIVNKEYTDSYLKYINDKYYKKYEKYLSIYKLNIASGAKLFKHLNEVLV